MDVRTLLQLAAREQLAVLTTGLDAPENGGPWVPDAAGLDAIAASVVDGLLDRLTADLMDALTS